MSVNKVMLIGNLGADPEIRTSTGGMAICTLRIATTERQKERNGDGWEDHTEWHRVVCFGKVAENVGKFLEKGRQVYVEGKIRTRKWQDDKGNDRYSTEIIADTVQFLGGGNGKRNEDDRSTGSSSGGSKDRGVPDDDIPYVMEAHPEDMFVPPWEKMLLPM